MVRGSPVRIVSVWTASDGGKRETRTDSSLSDHTEAPEYL